MKWGIIGAMPSEVEVLKQQMEDLNEVKVGRLLFWEGILCGQEAVVCCCGIGKVNAAITTQMMIDRFEVERIINTGIAGGLASGLAVGDIVVADGLVQHDFDAAPIGFVRGCVCMGDPGAPTVFAPTERTANV